MIPLRELDEEEEADMVARGTAWLLALLQKHHGGDDHAVRDVRDGK